MLLCAVLNLYMRLLPIFCQVLQKIRIEQSLLTHSFNFYDFIYPCSVIVQVTWIILKMQNLKFSITCHYKPCDEISYQPASLCLVHESSLCPACSYYICSPPLVTQQPSLLSYQLSQHFFLSLCSSSIYAITLPSSHAGIISFYMIKRRELVGQSKIF